MLNLAEGAQLTLRTPKGAVIRAPVGSQRGRTLTIDYFWVTSVITIEYEGEDLRARSDYYL